MRPSEITAASALQLMAFLPFACAVPSFGDKLYPRQDGSGVSSAASGAAAATGSVLATSQSTSGMAGGPTPLTAVSAASTGPINPAQAAATSSSSSTTSSGTTPGAASIVVSSVTNGSRSNTGSAPAADTPGLIPSSAVVCGEVASYNPSYNSSNPATLAQAQAFSVGQITVLLDQQNTRWQGFFPGGDGGPSVVAVELQGQAQMASASGPVSTASTFPYTGPAGMRFAISDTLLEGVTNAISAKCAMKGATGFYFIPLGQPVQNATSQPVIRFMWSKNFGSSMAD